MSEVYWDREHIMQIKEYTKADDKLKNELIERVRENNLSKKSFNFKYVLAACAGATVIGGIMLMYTPDSVKKENTPTIAIKQAARVEDIDIVGMSGKEILKLVNINKPKDISKIEIQRNKLADVSWVCDLDNVSIVNQEEISTFYNYLSELKIVELDDVKTDSKESDAPKEREIVIYLNDGTNQTIHYNPVSKSLMQCFTVEDNPIERKLFNNISDEFNDWLVKICDIDIEKDYTDDYRRYGAIQSNIAALQSLLYEEWFGGYDVQFVNGKLKLRVLLRDNVENNREKVLQQMGDKQDVIFTTSKVNYQQLKKIKENISEIIFDGEGKHPYIIGCALTSKDIEIVTVKDITKKQREELMEVLSEYSDVINIVSE